MRSRIVPNLWLETDAEEPARFDTSVFPRSRILRVSRCQTGGPREAGIAMTVEFELDGRDFSPSTADRSSSSMRRCPS